MTPPNRQHPRFAHEAAVTIHADGLAHSGKTTNVSRGGLCADLVSFIPIGTDVVVDLQLVFDCNHKSEALQLQGRVVWCTNVDGTRQTGLAFQKLRPEQAEYLTVFLRYLDNPTRDKIRTRFASVDERFC